MNPPTVLLDRSFLIALADPTADRHDDVVACYHALVDEFEGDRLLLAVRSDVRNELRATLPRGLIAPADTLHVAGQHRHAADHVIHPDADPDMALNMVLMQREKIRRIATLDSRYEVLDVTVLPGWPTAAIDDTEPLDRDAADSVEDVSSRTAPMPESR